MSSTLSQYLKTAEAAPVKETAFPSMEDLNAALNEASMEEYQLEEQIELLCYAEDVQQNLENLIATTEGFLDTGMTSKEARWLQVAAEAAGYDDDFLPECYSVEDFDSRSSKVLVSIALEAFSEKLMKIIDWIVNMFVKLGDFIAANVRKRMQLAGLFASRAKQLRERKNKSTRIDNIVRVVPSQSQFFYQNGKYVGPLAGLDGMQKFYKAFGANKKYGLEIKAFVDSLVKKADELANAGEGKWRSVMRTVTQIKVPFPSQFHKDNHNKHTGYYVYDGNPGVVVFGIEIADAEYSQGVRGAKEFTQLLKQGMKLKLTRSGEAERVVADTQSGFQPMEVAMVDKTCDAVIATAKLADDFHDNQKALLKETRACVLKIKDFRRKITNNKDIHPDAREVSMNLLNAAMRFARGYISCAFRSAMMVTSAMAGSMTYAYASVNSASGHGMESYSEEKHWNKAEREKAPDSDWAVPSKKKLRIDDKVHVRFAWSQVDRTEGLTDAEKAEARKRILNAAKRMGIDTSAWDKKA